MLALAFVLFQVHIVPDIPPCTDPTVAMCMTLNGELVCVRCVPDRIFADGFEPTP